MIYSLGTIRLGSMGAATNYCDQLLENVATYTRLSQKTDKSAETRSRAAAIAAENQSNWNKSCSPAAVAAKAAAKTVTIAAVSPQAPTTGVTASAAETVKQVAAAAAANPEVAKALNTALAPLGVSIQTQDTAQASNTKTYVMLGVGAVALVGLAWFFTRKKHPASGVKR